MSPIADIWLPFVLMRSVGYYVDLLARSELHKLKPNRRDTYKETLFVDYFRFQRKPRTKLAPRREATPAHKIPSQSGAKPYSGAGEQRE